MKLFSQEVTKQPDYQPRRKIKEIRKKRKEETKDERIENNKNGEIRRKNRQVIA